MIAWLGSILLSCCAIPLAWSAWKTKKDDTNTGLMIMWTAGEVALALSYYHDAVLMLNYLTNILCLSIVWYVRYKERY